MARIKEPLTKHIVSGGLSVVPSGLPESLRSRDFLPAVVNFSTCRAKMKMPAKEPASWLSRQVSNLNSSDPESDVLPITPRDNFADANIKKLFIYFRPCIF